jgi:hypothetical protein
MQVAVICAQARSSQLAAPCRWPLAVGRWPLAARAAHRTPPHALPPGGNSRPIKQAVEQKQRAAAAAAAYKLQTTKNAELELELAAAGRGGGREEVEAEVEVERRAPRREGGMEQRNI